MNLFDLFQEAALDHLEEETGSRTVDDDLRRRLCDQMNQLSKVFRGPDPIRYDSLERRLAYTMYYAPKHAYLWKFYARAQWEPRKILRLNSLGTGPASELIGLGEAMRDRGLVRIEARCLEREHTWRRLAHRVFYRYTEVSPVSIRREWVSDSQNFMPRWHLVGSFVLSELVRDGAISSLVPAMRQRIPGSRATFIDELMVMVATGSKYLRDIVKPDAWCAFSKLGIECEVEINRAWQASSRICGHQLPSEPGVGVFKYFFRT